MLKKIDKILENTEDNISETNKTDTLLDSIIKGDNISAAEAFKEIMVKKQSEAIQKQKIKLASNIYSKEDE